MAGIVNVKFLDILPAVLWQKKKNCKIESKKIYHKS